MCIFIVWKQLETSVPSFDWSLEVMFHLNLYLWDHFVISISSWQIFYIYFDWKWKKLYVFIMWKQLETNILSIWMIVREVRFHLNLHLWDHFVISISSWQILYICLDWKWKKLMCIFIMWKHLWDHFVISISSWQIFYICLDWKWKKLMCIFIMWKQLETSVQSIWLIVREVRFHLT